MDRPSGREPLKELLDRSLEVRVRKWVEAPIQDTEIKLYESGSIGRAMRHKKGVQQIFYHADVTLFHVHVNAQ